MLACARVVDDPVIGTASYRYPRDEQASGFKTDLNRLWMFDSAIIGAFPCEGFNLCLPVRQRKRYGRCLFGCSSYPKYLFPGHVLQREPSVRHRS